MENPSPNPLMKEEDHLQSSAFFDSFFTERNCNTYGWGPLQTYPPYTEIIKQDDPSNAAYFIHEGIVKLSWIDQCGHEMIAGLRYRDWIIGAPSVLLKKSYSFTVTTLEKSVLRCISAKNFLYLVRTNPKFVIHILRILCQEYFTQGKKLGILGCVSGRDRLKHLLCQFIRDVYKQSPMHEKIKVHLPLKHKEIAQIIAVSPEHLSRLLKELEMQKVIRREKEDIILLDHEMVQQWATL